LLLLLAPVVLVPGGCLQLQRAMNRIVHVNVRARPWIRCLYPLVHRSLLGTVERRVNCFLLHDTVLDVILFLLVIVLARTWILGEGLPSVGSLSFMLPKFTSLSFSQERLGLLTNELTIGGRPQVVIGSLLNRGNCLVSARAWSEGLNLGVLAVGHLRLENSVFTSRIELLLALFVKVVHSWPWVVRPCHVIVLEIVLFENLSLNFTLVELVLRMLLPNGWLLWIVRCWTNSVKASCSIGGGCELPCWNTVGDRLRNNC
jgi:hypothetical protein